MSTYQIFIIAADGQRLASFNAGTDFRAASKVFRHLRQIARIIYPLAESVRVVKVKYGTIATRPVIK